MTDFYCAVCPYFEQCDMDSSCIKEFHKDNAVYVLTETIENAKALLKAIENGEWEEITK